MVPKPDLVVRSPSVTDNSLETGDSFTLSVTVANDGAGNAAWRPTLLYYRSTDGGTITGVPSDGDTEEGAERTDEQKEIGALFARGYAQPFDQPDGAVGGGHVLLRRVHASGFRAGIGHYEQLLGIRGSRRIELAGQPGSGAATSHRMHGSRRARVDAGSGSMGIRVRTH